MGCWQCLQLGRSLGEASQQLVDRLPDGVQKADSISWPPRNRIYSPSHLLPAFSHGAPDLILRMLLERMSLSGSIPTAGEAGHAPTLSHFPEEVLFSHKQASLGEGDAGMVRLFLLAAHCVQTPIFLLRRSAGTSPLGTWIPLGCARPWWLPKSVFSSCSQVAAKRGWTHSQTPPGYTACYLMHRWMRHCLSPLVNGAGPHSFHRGTFVCGWMLIFVVGRVDRSRDSLWHHDAGITQRAIDLSICYVFNSTVMFV